MSDGGFQELMKGKRNLPLCVSQMDVGIVAVAWVAGTRDYRQKTSVQSLLQSHSRGLHAPWLIWHAWKWATRKCKGKTKETLSEQNPWATFDKSGAKNVSFKYILACLYSTGFLFLFFLSLPWDNMLAQSRKGLSNTFSFPLRLVPNWEIYTTALGSQAH